ncbi:ComF family protein [Hafnia paralvei]|uniref:ComF family protein n=1 Tax=Hafnia paralvei TaxID=546367 RepID=UPI0038D0A56F
MLTSAITRTKFTTSQTLRNRISRWQNMENVFELPNPAMLANKHILLVDDVITTGATLEACGSVLLKAPGSKISIAAVAYTI